MNHTHYTRSHSKKNKIMCKIVQGWQVACGHHAEKPAIDSLSFREVDAKIRRLAGGLESVGLSTGARVLLGLVPGADFVAMDLALQAMGAVSVVVDPGMSALEISRLVKELAPSVLVLERPTADEVLGLGKDALEGVTCLIERVPAGADPRGTVELKGGSTMDVFTVGEVEEEGGSAGADVAAAFPKVEPEPESLLSITFTTGTTGAHPKAVFLTQANFMSAVAGVLRSGAVAFSGSTLLSCLPLSTPAERCLVFVALLEGARVHFMDGDPADPAVLRRRLTEVRPSVLSGSPGMLEGCVAAIRAEVDSGSSGWLTKALFGVGVEAKGTTGNGEEAWDAPVWDLLVFSDMRTRFFGGGLSRILCSQGTVTPEVYSFLRASCCCPVLSVYALAECAGPIAISLVGTPHGPGVVGPPVPSCEIKLVYSDSGDAEVFVRGPSVSLPSADANGWLGTGDAGLWSARDAQALQLCGRTANRLTLAPPAQGGAPLFVFPERVEAALAGSTPIVTDTFVWSDPVNPKDFVVCVAVCDAGALVAAHPEQCGGDEAKDASRALHEDVVVEAILAALKKRGAEAGLAPHEIPQAVQLTLEPFSLAAGTLTASREKKRGVIAERFKSYLAFGAQKVDYERRMRAQGLLKDLPGN